MLSTRDMNVKHKGVYLKNNRMIKAIFRKPKTARDLGGKTDIYISKIIKIRSVGFRIGHLILI